MDNSGMKENNEGQLEAGSIMSPAMIHHQHDPNNPTIPSHIKLQHQKAGGQVIHIQQGVPYNDDNKQ